MDLVRTEAYDLALLAELNAASAEHAGFLVGAKLGLYEPDEEATRTKALASYVAPGYTGYAPQTNVLAAAEIADDGLPVLVGGTLTFRPTDALGTTTVVRGVILTDSTGAILYAAGKFDSAEAMAKATDALHVALKVAANGDLSLVKVA